MHLTNEHGSKHRGGVADRQSAGREDKGGVETTGIARVKLEDGVAR